jgi:uncharacterized membrane protein YdbT with pleckstrin-like domain
VVETHRHGIVLMRPLFRSSLLAAAGVGCFFLPWRPAAVAGAVLLALAALLVVVAVARWDRTHLELTANALVVEYGFLRRGTASVSLNATVFEIERSFLGRILGYATVVAGDLEIDAVPRRITRRLHAQR